MPVTFPTGRLRLATRPAANGSPTPAKTTGNIEVAALAASVDGVPPAANSTVTRRPTRLDDRVWCRRDPAWPPRTRTE